VKTGKRVERNGTIKCGTNKIAGKNVNIPSVAMKWDGQRMKLAIEAVLKLKIKDHQKQIISNHH
jgi:hypothetical protein